MELIVRECPSNGTLGGPFEKTFTVHTGLQHGSAEISIEQFSNRVIIIHATENDSVYDLHHLYFALKRLLMLLDGQFYPITSVREGEIEITASIQRKLLSSYHSADFMIGSSNHLISFDEVLSEALFDNWCMIQDELDIVHNMVLYSLSSVEMPIDMKCAFLIEAFSGVGELVQRRKESFDLPVKTRRDQSELCMRLEYIINCYGKEIFRDECQQSPKKLAEILTNSRNRIAHIKSKQDKAFLNGKESVLYLCKLSL